MGFGSDCEGLRWPFCSTDVRLLRLFSQAPIFFYYSRVARPFKGKWGLSPPVKRSAHLPRCLRMSSYDYLRQAWGGNKGKNRCLGESLGKRAQGGTECCLGFSAQCPPLAPCFCPVTFTPFPVLYQLSPKITWYLWGGTFSCGQTCALPFPDSQSVHLSFSLNMVFIVFSYILLYRTDRCLSLYSRIVCHQIWCTFLK